jgi:hypothetical protein
MFERENRFVALEYDDCDVSVTHSGGETIDDQMRSIGFQVMTKTSGQKLTAFCRLKFWMLKTFLFYFLFISLSETFFSIFLKSSS